jgi:hypothetical protein
MRAVFGLRSLACGCGRAGGTYQLGSCGERAENPETKTGSFARSPCVLSPPLSPCPPLMFYLYYCQHQHQLRFQSFRLSGTVCEYVEKTALLF